MGDSRRKLLTCLQNPKLLEWAASRCVSHILNFENQFPRFKVLSLRFVSFSEENCSLGDREMAALLESHSKQPRGSSQPSVTGSKGADSLFGPPLAPGMHMQVQTCLQAEHSYTHNFLKIKQTKNLQPNFPLPLTKIQYILLLQKAVQI